MLGLETALALALTELDLPLAEVLGPAVVAAGGVIAGVADDHGGTARRRVAPANLCVIDPQRHLDGRPHASWRRKSPQHALRRPPAAGAGSATRSSRGEAVVLDGEAQR